MVKSFFFFSIRTESYNVSRAKKGAPRNKSLNELFEQDRTSRKVSYRSREIPFPNVDTVRTRLYSRDTKFFHGGALHIVKNGTISLNKPRGAAPRGWPARQTPARLT